MNKEILELADIRLLVDSFYDKVREDDRLASVFNEKIGDQWPKHLERMYRFWQTILLEEHTYHGSPFAPHAGLPVNRAHFDRWLYLFYQTVDENFTGELAREAKWRAGKMAQMFLYKIEYHKNNNVDPHH
ncbi:hypothetical protein GCM10009122_23640 [Fulvivirga kasyanovii]|uniref:Group III truncated hemoglobin n=1 Tax=Fulvivirga kasyanovii TaxID=396812 RepID=A0ABW9RJB8_9BACT|nr:group III truncated hemoglobin [Fulvivirga kasyanovii]MTI24172.1 group III truncated hemoglobin [Fulvivirga kasyanovii]